jgi:MEMO1 family protein
MKSPVNRTVLSPAPRAPESRLPSRDRKGAVLFGQASFNGALATSFAALCLIAAGLLPACHGAGGGADEALKVRPAAVAGSFYPADPKALAAAVDRYIAQAGPASFEAVALLSPHAGYEYSGPVAGYAYASLKSRKIDRVVLIAPSHYEAFGFSSVFDGAAYTTPLGQVPVDHAFAAKLADGGRLIRLSRVGHAPSKDKLEHSVEVELPFLQRALGTFQIVPIVMGDQSYEACRALGLALAKAITGANTLIVVSSDLSHYHTYDEAVKMDHKTLKAIEEWDYLSLSRNFDRRIWEACGGGPIIAAMIASERLGATHARVLKYANSGDATGDRSRVVGYGAVAFVRGAPGAKDAPFALSRQDKDELLRIARKSVETAVRERRAYEPPAPASEALSRERGAFVTLKKQGALRGCIGFMSPMKPLYLTVSEVARYAALEDTRFKPVSEGELASLEYEISALSGLRRVLDVKEIEVGRDGLLLHKGDIEGVLLPQVPVEQHWNRATFLEEVSMKAGLPPRAWQDAAADLFRFTALVFGDSKLAPDLTPPALPERREPNSTPPPAPPF